MAKGKLTMCMKGLAQESVLGELDKCATPEFNIFESISVSQKDDNKT